MCSVEYNWSINLVQFTNSTFSNRIDRQFISITNNFIDRWCNDNSFVCSLRNGGKWLVMLSRVRLKYFFRPNHQANHFKLNRLSMHLHYKYWCGLLMCDDAYLLRNVERVLLSRVRLNYLFRSIRPIRQFNIFQLNWSSVHLHCKYWCRLLMWW